MYCVACGAEHSVGAPFCTNCGAALAARCAYCHADLAPAARFCAACGRPSQSGGSSTPARPQETRPEIQRKQVTVLFADFAGFTAFAHERDAEEVREFIGSIWAKLDRIIESHGGLVEKHIGDAIMAVFGAQQAREDDPAQAVRSALAMQASLAELKDDSGRNALRMRIGIHTGLVVVGPIGGGGEVTVTGDTVNLASRLEANAPEGGLLVSQETYRQVHGLFEAEAQAPLAVSGIPEPVRSFRILRARPRWLASQLRGIEGLDMDMVGRERELGQIQAALREVMETGNSLTVTIVGEAGIGKSCLWRAFQNWLELLADPVRFFFGRAGTETTTLPYAVLRDVLFARFEIQDSDAPTVARQKFEEGVSALMRPGAGLSPPEAASAPPDGGAGDAQAAAHFMGQLLGLDFSSSRSLRPILDDPEQIRQRAFFHFGKFFQTAATGTSGVSGKRVRAAILVAEDVHWADDGSLDLLAHLRRACPHVPLLMVVLARPTLLERRPDWLDQGVRIELQPLDREHSLALVHTILRRAERVPPALRELIVNGAEGIPFYMEELVKMFIDQRVIEPGEDLWQVREDRLGTARVPSTLTGILQARLDGLAPVDRLVLQRGSAFGRFFWDGAVPELGAVGETVLSREETADALRRLQARELIVRRETSAFAGVIEYAFKHELLRNVAYESLVRKLRSGYHAEIARWLIRQAGQRVGEFAGPIAGHFERAKIETEAMRWYGLAGQQARSGFAPATAIEFYRKALALSATAGTELHEDGAPSGRLGWYEGLVDVLGAQARFDEALEACSAQRQLAEAGSDLVAQSRAWNNMSFLNERLGKNRAAVDSADQAQALARQAGDDGRGERIRALLLKGWAFYRLSDAAAVLRLGDEARDLCMACGNQSGLATSHKLHGVAHLQLGRFREADRFFREGLELYESVGDRRNAASMLNNLAESARMRGDYDEAEALYERALANVRQIGHRESEAIYLTNLSAARLGLQKFARAESELLEAISLTDGLHFCALSATYSFLCEARLGLGKFEEARDAARRGLALAQESENDLDLGTAWRALGLVAAAVSAGSAHAANVESANEGPPGAEVCFESSLRIFRKIGAAGDEAATLRCWAEFERRRGREDDARSMARSALEIFRRLGAGGEVARTEAVLA